MLSLLSLRISTTLLSVEQFGVFALLAAMRSFFGLFFINPVGQHINRHTHEWVNDGSLFSKLYYFNRYLFFITILSVLTAAGWALLGGTLTAEEGWLAAIVMGLSVYAGTWNNTLIPILNMAGFRGVSVCFEILTSLLVLLGSALLVWKHDSGVYWFTGSIFGLSVVAVLAFFSIRKKLCKPAHACKAGVLFDQGTVVSYCLPLAAATGLLWLLTSGYRFVVEWGWGSIALGFMAAGFGIARQMWSICETLSMQFLFPHFYKAISDGDDEQQRLAYTNLINTLAPLYLLLLGISVAAGGWALSVLIDEKFHEAYRFVLFGAITEWCRVMAGLFSQAAQVKKRTSYCIIPFAVAGLFAITASVLAGIMHFPLVSVASILVGSGIMLVGLMWWQMNKLIPIAINWKNILYLGSFAAGIIGVSLLLGAEPKPLVESMIALSITGLVSLTAITLYLRRCREYQALLLVRLR